MRRGDLLKCGTSLAHCVSRDLKMFKGLAKSFKETWPDHIDQLKKMYLHVGQIGAIKVKGRFIYHLITKERCTDQPKYFDLRQTLFELKQHMLANNVKKVALPKIGCGMNRLSWPDVKTMMEEVFWDTNIKITVFEFDDSKKLETAKTASKSEANGDSMVVDEETSVDKNDEDEMAAEDGESDKVSKVSIH